MGSYTGGTKLYKPTVGEVDWGALVNTNFDRLSEFTFSVKSYGAVGDGTTDDTAAFQDTYNAIPTVNGRKSGILLIPAGHYALTAGQLSFTDAGVDIRGAGKSTLLHFKTGTGAGLAIDGTALGVSGIENWHLEGFCVMGADNVTPAIKLSYTHRGVAKDVWVRGTGGTAWELNFCLLNHFDSCGASTNIGYDSVSPRGAMRRGLHLKSVGTNACNNNLFTGCSWEGITTGTGRNGTASTTVASTTLTSSDLTFTAADVGRVIVVYQAGPFPLLGWGDSANNALVTVIDSVESSSSATMAIPAYATVTGQTASIDADGYGIDVASGTHNFFIEGTSEGNTYGIVTRYPSSTSAFFGYNTEANNQEYADGGARDIFYAMSGGNMPAHWPGRLFANAQASSLSYPDLVFGQFQPNSNGRNKPGLLWISDTELALAIGGARVATFQSQNLRVQGTAESEVDIQSTSANSEAKFRLRNDAHNWVVFVDGAAADQLRFRSSTLGVNALSIDAAAGRVQIPVELQIPVVATASIPAAGASNDGLILIEDVAAGDRNLVIYAGGQRFRIDGGAAF